MNRADFTYTATSNGCTIFYKGQVVKRNLVKVRRGPVLNREDSAKYFKELAKYEINSIVMGLASRQYIDSVKVLEGVQNATQSLA